MTTEFPDKVYEVSSNRMIKIVIVAVASFFLVVSIYSWWLGMALLAGLAVILWTEVFRVLITADCLILNRRFSPDSTIDLSQFQQAQYIRTDRRLEGPLRLFYRTGGYVTYLSSADFSPGQIEDMADEINRRIEAMNLRLKQGQFAD